MAGTGKSTIARTIAHSFATQNRMGASFFFKTGEGELGNAKRFFTTLAQGLMTRVPEMKLGIKDALDNDPTVVDKSLEVQFRQLIIEPLSRVSYDQRLKLIVVIDALDECDQDKDICEIQRLLRKIKVLPSIALRFFVTSRPELHIRLGFDKMSKNKLENIILHEIATDVVKRDIKRYLGHQFATIRHQRSVPLNWPSFDQVEALANLASPLFIFAATACRYIGDPKYNPMTRLDTLLAYRTRVTSKLDATYLPILQLLYEEEEDADKEQWCTEFRVIVGSIVVLLSPLSISWLSKLLNVSKFDIGCRLDSLHSVIHVPNHGKDPIRILHLSFRDFLLDSRKEGKSPLWIDERKAHGHLVSRCLDIMSSPGGLKHATCDSQRLISNAASTKPEEAAKNLPLHLQYACRYWLTHVKHSQCQLQDGCPEHIFLERHFLHWLEIVSFMGEFENSIARLESILELVEVSSLDQHRLCLALIFHAVARK